VFNLSGSELIFLLLAALVILGPEKLPDAIRRAGRLYAELKRMSSGFQSELKAAMDEPMRELRETAELTRRAMNFDPDAVLSDADPAAPTSDDPPDDLTPSTDEGERA
jgi:sec-independent protein translocase protein TatB